MTFTAGHTDIHSAHRATGAVLRSDLRAAVVATAVIGGINRVVVVEINVAHRFFPFSEVSVFQAHKKVRK